MDIITLLLITVFVCLVAAYISKYNQSTDKKPVDTESKTKSVLEELKKLNYNFKTDIQMESLAGDNVRINIVDPCDPADKNKRKTCTISDPTSCNLCPYTTCTHFETDASIGDKIIPRNLNKDDGYCISSNDLSKDCNKYHGDWVMIKASAYNKDNDNANDYIRFCLCKKPGFIGNRTLFGNCSTPFICDGKVEDINVDYKSIKCQCFDEYYSTNVGDDGRICKAPTVSKRVNWSNVPKPLKFKDSYIKVRDYYNHNVQGDVNQLDELIDPCSICPITGQLTYGESVTIENSDPAKTTVICRPSNNNPGKIGNFGIPVRREFKDNKRLLKGTWGPDAMLAIQWDELWVYDSDGEGEHKGSKQICVFIFQFSEYNTAFYDKFHIDHLSYCAIESHKDALLGLTVLPKSSFMTTININCWRKWLFSFECTLSHKSRIGKVTAGELVINLMNDDLHEVVSTYIGTKSVEPISNLTNSVNWKDLYEMAMPFNEALITLDDVDYRYLTYNQKVLKLPVLQQMNYGAMRITPLKEGQRIFSEWNGHGSGTRHYEVYFMPVKEDMSRALAQLNIHTIVRP